MARRKLSAFVVSRQADVADFCGVSIDTVKSWAKRGMPGKPPRYDLQTIVQWLRKDGPWQPRGPQLRELIGDESLLDGAADSPALEKLRAAKAALAELDLQERRGSLVSVERSKEIGLRWAALIKRLGERLGKRWGRDATTAVNDTLEECQRVLDDGYAGPADADADAELVDTEREAAGGSPDKPVGGARGRRSKRPP